MDDIQLRKEVFAWFGGAAYAAQCFEIELVNLLLLAHRLHEPSLTSEQLDGIDTRLSRSNLKQLLDELKKHFVIHPEFDAILNDYREKRNYLAHRFFFKNAWKLTSREGCESMIAELKAIEASMRGADAIAQTMSRRVGALLGISEEQVQRLVGEARLREAKEESE